MAPSDGSRGADELFAPLHLRREPSRHVPRLVFKVVEKVGSVRPRWIDWWGIASRRAALGTGAGGGAKVEAATVARNESAEFSTAQANASKDDDDRKHDREDCGDQNGQQFAGHPVQIVEVLFRGKHA